MKGKIFNLQRFCTMDGDGIRTTVFFKGCPLSCKWCHNPESQSPSFELGYDKNNCVNCFACVDRCKNNCHKALNGNHVLDRTNCSSCGECVNVNCSALSIYGKEVTVDEILTEVIKDKDYYDASGGGITISGGEPFYQVDFLEELLKKAKQLGLNTCVETCGYVSQNVLKRTLDYVDTYLFDYKETNPKKHLEFTGKDNDLIIKNLKFLDSNNKKIVLRCPIIPNYNDRLEHFKGIGELSSSLKNVIKVAIEPYHDLGEQKYARLGREYNASTTSPNKKEVQTYINEIKKFTNKKVDKA